MATKHDEFKVYYFSFDEEELDRIVSALRVSGDDELADEIADEIYGNCDDCDCEKSIGIDSSDVAEAREELDNLAKAAREVIKVSRELDEEFFGMKRKDVDSVGIAELVAALVADSVAEVRVKI